MQGGYKIRNQSAAHFITFAVVDWVDVFTRKEYRDVLLESIRYCQANKGLQLHAWCIMSNHVHFVMSATSGNLSDVLRDFKKFASGKLLHAIASSARESRREWMLRIFSENGQCNQRNSGYQFWQQNNCPQEVYSPAFICQKINYIHNNPVEAGIVLKPSDYLYSSAVDYDKGRSCGLLEVVFL